MPIVSLSIPDQMVRDLDEIQESGGFAGRSELVRAAVRLLFEDAREKEALKGHLNAVMVVTHDELNEAPVTRIKHTYEEIVRTHIHNKISRNNCVEMFLLEGDGKTISSMTREFQREDKLKSVKLIVLE